MIVQPHTPSPIVPTTTRTLITLDAMILHHMVSRENTPSPNQNINRLPRHIRMPLKAIMVRPLTQEMTTTVKREVHRTEVFGVDWVWVVLEDIYLEVDREIDIMATLDMVDTGVIIAVGAAPGVTMAVGGDHGVIMVGGAVHGDQAALRTEEVQDQVHQALAGPHQGMEEHQGGNPIQKQYYTSHN